MFLIDMSLLHKVGLMTYYEYLMKISQMTDEEYKTHKSWLYEIYI